MTVDLPNAAATGALGRALADILRPGDIVALRGGLGAGKTTLVRGLIQSRLDEDVPSPTFTLVQTYPWNSPEGETELWHLDLYRLKQPSDALELGVEDAFHHQICLIEWPERLGAYLPEDRLDIHLHMSDTGPSGGRRCRISGSGGWAARLQALGEIGEIFA